MTTPELPPPPLPPESPRGCLLALVVAVVMFCLTVFGAWELWQAIR